MNYKQNQLFHVLLNELPMSAEDRAIYKKALISDISKGRTMSSKDLTDMEAHECINFLKSKVNNAEELQKKAAINAAENTKKEGDRMRKKLLSIAYQLHWAPVGQWQKAFEAIDKFLLSKHGKVHTPVREMGNADLVKVVTQFDEMLLNELKR